MQNLSIDSQPEIEAKINSLEALLPLVEQNKARGETIVTTNGTYDLLHIGHVMSLFESKRQGDELIVGVNSDRSVQSYKSPERPMSGILPEKSSPAISISESIHRTI